MYYRCCFAGFCHYVFLGHVRCPYCPGEGKGGDCLRGSYDPVRGLVCLHACCSVKRGCSKALSERKLLEESKVVLVRESGKVKRFTDISRKHGYEPVIVEVFGDSGVYVVFPKKYVHMACFCRKKRIRRKYAHMLCRVTEALRFDGERVNWFVSDDKNAWRT